MEITIKKTELLRFLKGVMLSGIINDAVIKIDAKKKIISAACIDEYSIIFVNGSVIADEIKGEDSIFSVCDLPLLYRVVDVLVLTESVIMEYKDNVLKIGKSKIATVASEDIKSFYMDKDGKLAALLKMYKNVGIEIACSELNNILTHISVFTPQQLLVSNTSRGIIVQPIESYANQFKVNIRTAIKTDQKTTTTLTIGCKYLTAILTHLTSFENDKILMGFTTPESPLLIKTDNFLWLVSPVQIDEKTTAENAE